jgi:hypothetical protein
MGVASKKESVFAVCMAIGLNKSKINETLKVVASEKTLDRALNIFSTVIKVLRLRGHDIRIRDGSTFAVINEEEIRIDITEHRKQQTVEGTSSSTTAYCGELHFNISYGYTDESYKDTMHTRMVSFIISGQNHSGKNGKDK